MFEFFVELSRANIGKIVVKIQHPKIENPTLFLLAVYFGCLFVLVYYFLFNLKAKIKPTINPQNPEKVNILFESPY